ncbi:MAG: efflux transporter outer membrane subunit [Verrucomicrobiales bacterium]|nr:efflux transporter outer membrane subunit [Verrucomicrobiales bacterium]
MSIHLRFLSLLPCLYFAGCAEFPNGSVVDHMPFSEPTALQVSSQYKTSTSQSIPVIPQWWTLFRDEELNALVRKVDDGSFELKAGLARIERACAVLGVSRSDLYPQLNGEGSAIKTRTSKNDLGSGGGIKNNYNQYRAAMGMEWEFDLWGRIKYLINSAEADVEATMLAQQDLRLSLKGQLAQNYFALRFLDEEHRVLTAAVKIRIDNVKLASDRFKAGRTGELDVARAETELATARASLASISGQRTRLENAIAVIVGEPASDFRISRTPKAPAYLPAIKAGVPMNVLENRPDIAAQIKVLKSIYNRIGSAKAEFLPRVSLISSAGLSSIDAGDFLSWSSRTFTLGPSISTPIFQGGRLRSNQKQIEAECKEAVADYQQLVLVAFREVEDALADLASARNQRDAQLEALSASRKSLNLSIVRYQEGLVNSLETIDATREQLNIERGYVQIRALEYDATVRLIRALGGASCLDAKACQECGCILHSCNCRSENSQKTVAEAKAH